MENELEHQQRGKYMPRESDRQSKKRLDYLKELLQQELKSQEPSLHYIDDLQFSIWMIERQMKLPAYEMLENE